MMVLKTLSAEASQIRESIQQPVFIPQQCENMTTHYQAQFPPQQHWPACGLGRMRETIQGHQQQFEPLVREVAQFQQRYAPQQYSALLSGRLLVQMNKANERGHFKR
jgi:hypothetical protein